MIIGPDVQPIINFLILQKLWKKGNVITLEEMQKAREDMDNFHKFCKLFLSSMVGRHKYNKKVHLHTISEIATASDEAFVLLCLENSLDRWQHEHEKPEEVKKTPVYTASPAEASKYGGWSEAGIHRYNELLQHIVPEMRQNS